MKTRTAGRLILAGTALWGVGLAVAAIGLGLRNEALVGIGVVSFLAALALLWSTL